MKREHSRAKIEGSQMKAARLDGMLTQIGRNAKKGSSGTIRFAALLKRGLNRENIC